MGISKSKEQLQEDEAADKLFEKGRTAYDKSKLPTTPNAEKIVLYKMALDVWEEFISKYSDNVKIHQVHALKRKTSEMQRDTKAIEDGIVDAAKAKVHNKKIEELQNAQAEKEKEKQLKRLAFIASEREKAHATEAVRHAEAHAAKIVSSSKIRIMTEEIKKTEELRAKEFAAALAIRKQELLDEQAKTAEEELQELRKRKEENKKMEEEFEKLMKVKAAELEVLREESKIKREQQQKERDALAAENKKKRQEDLLKKKEESEARMKVAAEKAAAEAEKLKIKHEEELKVKKAAKLAEFEKAKQEAAAKAEKDHLQHVKELEELARVRERNALEREKEAAEQMKRKQQLIADNEAARKAKVEELTAAHLRLQAATEKALRDQAETLAAQALHRQEAHAANLKTATA